MKLKSLFYFRRSDRRVLLFCLALFVVVVAILCLSGQIDILPSDNKDIVDRKGDVRDSNSFHGYYRYGNRSGRSRYYAVKGRRVSRFYFDPNTADSTQLLSLGLQPWQVRNIYKYRAAGGIYRRKEDFARLYGLTNKQYHDLEPYIKIGEDYQPYVIAHGPRYAHTRDSFPVHHYPTKLKVGQRIELNSSDTTQLMKVPGIGSYYAKKIAYQRKRLGGFYSERQLLEIEDFPDDALSYFYVKTEGIKKININELPLNKLKRHPYINYYQAKDIVTYRRLRGAIKNINDLKLMKDFTKRDLERLKYYIEY